MFAGKDWQVTLRDVAWAQLQMEHGEWLQFVSADDITAMVIDPRRWDLSNAHALVIQFQPYEVSGYAYGAPTINIPWDILDTIKAETQDQVLWGR